MKVKTNSRWVAKVVAIGLVTSMIFTLASTHILGSVGYVMAFILLLAFILLGIIFDLVGVAVTAADVAPLHAKAAHREKGAAEAVKLIKNAEKVSSVCNDVVGDISSIVSGSTAALITARLMMDFSTENMLVQMSVSAFATALTIGGKAVGKTVALNSSTAIILRVGKIINFISGLFRKR